MLSEGFEAVDPSYHRTLHRVRFDPDVRCESIHPRSRGRSCTVWNYKTHSVDQITLTSCLSLSHSRSQYFKFSSNRNDNPALLCEVSRHMQLTMQAWTAIPTSKPTLSSSQIPRNVVVVGQGYPLRIIVEFRNREI